MGSMADKGLKSHPYGFGIRCGMAYCARLLEELFVNVERLLHTDDRAISSHAKQPDEPTGSGLNATSFTRPNVLCVRVDQDSKRFMRSIPKYRLKELETKSNRLTAARPAAVERSLDQAGIDLSKAREYYSLLGGDTGVEAVNRVSTDCHRRSLNRST
jgi:hypothetical protein